MHNESVRLNDFHTGTTCTPTRAGLLTGRNCNETGAWHTVGGRSLLRLDEVTIADVLKTNGYETAIFGKWHLGDNYPYLPNQRGFATSVIHGGGGVGQTPDYWNNDYFDDVGVQLSHPSFCGSGGCYQYIILNNKGKWEAIGKSRSTYYLSKKGANGKANFYYADYCMLSPCVYYRLNFK